MTALPLFNYTPTTLMGQCIKNTDYNKNRPPLPEWSTNQVIDYS